MARIPHAPERSPARAVGLWVLLLCAGLSTVALADWTVRPRNAEDPTGSLPVARVTTEPGSKSSAVEILMDEQETVWLQWTATTPTPTRCPTAEVDAGAARLHYPVGPDCVWVGSRVRLRAGAHSGPGIPSSFLFALVNGTTLVVRHADPSGAYLEQGFDLKGSKRAVKAAVADLRIVPR